jgi:ABC-type sugar transport system ATPase subunit
MHLFPYNVTISTVETEKNVELLVRDSARLKVEPLLRVSQVTKRFGSLVALDSVSFDLEPGEILALAGENGSGKSTLSSIIAGIQQPEQGEIFINGTPIKLRQPIDAVEAGISLVQQDPVGAPAMSIAENVLLTEFRHPLRRLHRRELCEDARVALRRVGLSHDPNTLLGNLKPGERELVDLARAVYQKPKILILDEVTARLPQPDRLLSLVTEFAAEGTAVIFISHRFAEIHSVSNRVVVLRDGHKTADLSGGEISDQSISRAMVGRAITSLYRKPSVPIGEPVLAVEDLVTTRSPAKLNFEVRCGEILAIAGLTGAGRSEVLETIAGSRRAVSGTVSVKGQRVHLRNPRDARSVGVRWVPEDRHGQGLVLSTAVSNNVALSSWRNFRPASRQTERRKAALVVKQFGVRCADVDSPISSLSGGNQQKVVIGRALDGDACVLLLDEPTRGVDVGAREDLYELLGEALRANLAVVLVSSDLPELLGLADRIIVLHDGFIVGELSHSEATEESVVRLSCGGETSAQLNRLHAS